MVCYWPGGGSDLFHGFESKALKIPLGLDRGINSKQKVPWEYVLISQYFIRDSLKRQVGKLTI